MGRAEETVLLLVFNLCDQSKVMDGIMLEEVREAAGMSPEKSGSHSQVFDFDSQVGESLK